MNWDIWEGIERILLKYGINPILAVIPDNHDPKLAFGPAAQDFWDRVRAWQARGWAIGLHGYQHIYVNSNSGLVGITPQSEFAGIDPGVQEDKLRSGLEIFRHEKVQPDCWIAPSHSFDRNTVRILRKLGLQVISDGLWRWPHTDRSGSIWVPQQLWNRPCRMPPGIWTVCNHHNRWTAEDILTLERDVQEYSSLIITLKDAVSASKKGWLTLPDRIRTHMRVTAKYHVRPWLVHFLPLRRP